MALRAQKVSGAFEKRPFPGPRSTGVIASFLSVLLLPTAFFLPLSLLKPATQAIFKYLVATVKTSESSGAGQWLSRKLKKVVCRWMKTVVGE